MSRKVANPVLADSGEAVDVINREFYTRFPYPRPPITFPRLEDPDFETLMLNQSIGDFRHRTIPSEARIWVAGCGTNQAVYTALRFPRATVVGSDLSEASLQLARKNAASLGIENLSLRQENLNQVAYREEFDYVLNTGVIHHNASPAEPLANIARALRPGGVLEVMVYNQFHRIFNAAFQRAVRTLTRDQSFGDSYEEELRIARAIAATEPMASSVHLAPFRDSHESHLADALIQPVEHSYTVESLAALLGGCGLELLLPCCDQFDRMNDRVWTIRFSTPDLQQRVDALPDLVRWQIANLLLLDRSPMLWFFARRRVEGSDLRYETHVNDEFLERRFVPASTTLRNYVRGVGLDYRLSADSVVYPGRPQSDRLRQVVDRADGRVNMREILRELGIDPASHKEVTDIRNQTTTSLWPYLRAV